MNATLANLFPKLRKPAKGGNGASLTSAEIAVELEVRVAARVDAQARLSATEHKHAAAYEALDAASMTAAEAETVGIRNEIKVAERAISALESELAKQLALEAADALTTRRAVAERRLETEAPKLLSEYDRLAAQMAIVLAGLNQIEAVIEGVNDGLKAANRYEERIETIHRRYRFEAGRQEPDHVEIVDEWQESNPDGTWSRVMQFVRGETGEMEPRYGGRKVKREVRRPGRKHRDMFLPSLDTISLPAGRIGGEQHWPKGGSQ